MTIGKDMSISNMVDPNSSVFDAIHRLNLVSPKALLVVEGHKVLGVITDGDVRRGVLKKIDLSGPVSQIMRLDFISIEVKEFNSVNNDTLSKKYGGYKIVPIVENGVYQSFFVPDDIFYNLLQNRNTVGVIMSGGFGTRMGDLTSDTPKALLPINGDPMILHIVNKFKKSGINNLYISVYHLKDKIMAFLGDGNDFGVNIRYLEEPEPLGTAGSLSNLHNFEFDEAVILNCDIITDLDLRNLLEFHVLNKSTATMAVKEHIIKNPFGTVSFEANKYIGLVEKPVYRSFINTGIYVLSKSAMRVIESMERLDMPSVFDRLIALGEEPRVFPIIEDWHDVGTPASLRKVNLFET